MATSYIPWRERYRIHPACALFPQIAQDELLALGKDILAHGMTSPIVFWSPGRPPQTTEELYDFEKGLLLDGRNRLDAVERAGGEVRLSSDPREVRRSNRKIFLVNLLFEARIDGGGADVVPGIDPWEFVVSANILRRHLTTAQKQGLVEALLLQAPERSNNATAKLARVDDKTVGAARRRLEASGKMPKVAATRGADGRMRRTYYAVKTGDRESPPPPVNTAASQATIAQPQVDIGISEVYRKKQKPERKVSPGELKLLAEEFCRRYLDRQTVLDMIDHLADFFDNADDIIDKLLGRLSPGEVSELRRELENLVGDEDLPAPQAPRHA
jgi:hypothetical protein